MIVTTSPTGDPVCEHGTAVDVHCCDCHSGFLFDANACVCASRPADDFRVLGSGYEAGFDAGYSKGFADGLDESSGDPRVQRIEAGFKAITCATNGEYSHEDHIVLDALQAGRDFAVRLARREAHIQQLIDERVEMERLVRQLQDHAREHSWQDVDEPLAALLACNVQREAHS